MKDYESYDALGLAELVRKGETSAEALLEHALERTAKRNPGLNAVNMVWADEARAAIRAGLPDGPFRGVPWLLKDLHAQVAGRPLTFGSRLYQDFVSESDSEITLRYRRAGLVLFGRTTSPEFGLTATTESVLWGETRNPWNPAHTSGGSSGGASAAVAAGILPAAHASDGGGSIRIPASCCGLLGMKPTRARVPSGPHSGEGWGGMSTAHAVTRSVRDSAALLDATQGPDLGSPYQAPDPERPYLDEVSRAPGRLRIGLVTETFNGAPTHADCRNGALEAAKLCESLGHAVEPVEIRVDAAALGRATQVLIAANVQATVEERAAALGREVSTELIENITWFMVQGARAASAADYARAIRLIHAVGRQIEARFQELDVLLSPTMAAPPSKIGELALSNAPSAEYIGHLQAATGYTQLFNVTGQPAMSVPLHWNAAGLPIGIQFAARFGDEATLYRLAGQLEQAQPWWNRRPSLAGGQAGA